MVQLQPPDALSDRYDSMSFDDKKYTGRPRVPVWLSYLHCGPGTEPRQWGRPHTFTPKRSMRRTVMSTYGCDTSSSVMRISTPPSPVASGAAISNAVRYWLLTEPLRSICTSPDQTVGATDTVGPVRGNRAAGRKAASWKVGMRACCVHVC